MSRANKQRKLKKRRALDKNRPKRMDVSTIGPANLPGGIRLVSHDISFDPVQDDDADTVVTAIGEETAKRLYDLLYSDPAGAIETIRAALASHPDSQTLNQWLCAALRATGNVTEAEQIAKSNYEKNPDYLFARLDYFKSLLHRGDVDRVERLLDKQFDLKVMYPQRDVFHISEFTAFYGFMIEFWLRKGEIKQASTYHGILAQMVPDEHATQMYSKLIASALAMKAIKRLGTQFLDPGRARF